MNGVQRVVFFFHIPISTIIYEFTRMCDYTRHFYFSKCLGKQIRLKTGVKDILSQVCNCQVEVEDTLQSVCMSQYSSSVDIAT